MRYNFLINTITPWEEPPRARHQVAYALSKKYPVVFVAANKIGLLSIETQKINENLTLITPYFPIDYRIRYRIPILNEIYQYWLFRRISGEYKYYKVINFDYTATRIFLYFANVIYYCNDSFYEISRKINPLLIARYHKKCEAKVATRSDFCVGVSLLIKNYLLNYNLNTIEIPLGSPDIDEFNLSIQKLPSGNEKIKVALVGVIIKLTISSNIINLLLKDNSVESLTIIGPIYDDVMKEIKGNDKLIVRGSLYDEELYEEINKCDVAVAPYSIQSGNEMLTGTGAKIYHYLSVGKPVVISFMSGLHRLELDDKLIYTAKEEEDFPVLVQRAHRENSAELIQRRIDFAKRNTWSKRIKDLLAHFEKLNSKSQNDD
ncbi:MAG: glycosyltransferase [Bacteroidales bacterium]|nr:glycosyltransferase [Bacteroidales bacterium]